MTPMHPTDWEDLCRTAFYDEATDALPPSADLLPWVPADRQPGPSEQRGSASPTDNRLAPSSTCVPPQAASETGSSGARTHDRRDLGGHGGLTWNACACGLARATRAHPYGYCPGGRDCLDRIMALDKEEPEATVDRSRAQTTEPTEDSMTHKDTPLTVVRP